MLALLGWGSGFGALVEGRRGGRLGSRVWLVSMRGYAVFELLSSCIRRIVLGLVALNGGFERCGAGRIRGRGAGRSVSCVYVERALLYAASLAALVGRRGGISTASSRCACLNTRCDAAAPYRPGSREDRFAPRTRVVFMTSAVTSPIWKPRMPSRHCSALPNDSYCATHCLGSSRLMLASASTSGPKQRARSQSPAPPGEALLFRTAKVSGRHARRDCKTLRPTT